MRDMGLSRPVRLVILRTSETPQGYCGLYESRKRFHKITLARFNPRGFKSVLAHELIHALIRELHPHTKKDHGIVFQYYCMIAEDKLKSIQLENPLYIHGVDVD
jgi:hypothetical protein